MKSHLLFAFLFLGSLAYAQYNFEQIDIWSGSNGGTAKYLTEFNGELYFQAFDLTPSFKKLYKTDGTQSGTVQVAPNLNGGAGYSPESLTVFNGDLIFTAFVSGLGTELYKTDGTEGGTILLKDIRPGSSSGMDFNTNNDLELFVEFSNELYFRGRTNSSIELWKTDGTEAGTITVKNFEDAQTGSPDFISNNGKSYLGVVFNNELYFTVNRSSTFELWKTDGTTAGTVLVRGSFTDPISNLIVFDNQLFFTATESATGNEIWTTDGTFSGTQIKYDIFPNDLNPFFGLGSGSNDFFIFNNEMFFSARSYDAVSNTIIGDELWKTDGTVANLVKNINTTVPSSVEGSGLNLPKFTTFNNELYFTANDGANGEFGLWKTDGTEAGTIEIVSVTDTGESFQFTRAIEYNGNLFYFNFQQLWVTDGTPSGTEILTDINGVNSSILLVQSGSLIQFNNQLWLEGFSSANGSELTSLTDTTLSLNELENSIELNIYPNPTKDILKIASNTVITKVEIYNYLGQKLGMVDRSNIDVTNFPVGQYILKIHTNETIQSKRFIKY
ncbi:T9SS type A sorting domain-containing protein [Winogradskyella sp. PG-2]|uniref:T9SS type A sorting domain-containing protein n=1 Tax=Winogradskyella sp. PG-2 TaxID=754409 RepID=UPI0004587F21|nr:T9SS type A sorting domain-containing protein [Winogradskyella sp. PG-2]BAO75255.1 flagellar hook-length control protein FliK [Winogradskyella sp. PG-2]